MIAAEADGRPRYEVEDEAPGEDLMVVAVVVRDRARATVAYRTQLTAKDASERERAAALERARADARTWLDAAYPKHREPLAYWDQA